MYESFLLPADLQAIVKPNTDAQLQPHLDQFLNNQTGCKDGLARFWMEQISQHDRFEPSTQENILITILKGPYIPDTRAIAARAGVRMIFDGKGSKALADAIKNLPPGEVRAAAQTQILESLDRSLVLRGSTRILKDGTEVPLAILPEIYATFGEDFVAKKSIARTIGKQYRRDAIMHMLIGGMFTIIGVFTTLYYSILHKSPETAAIKANKTKEAYIPLQSKPFVLSTPEKSDIKSSEFVGGIRQKNIYTEVMNYKGVEPMHMTAEQTLDLSRYLGSQIYAGTPDEVTPNIFKVAGAGVALSVVLPLGIAAIRSRRMTNQLAR